MDGGRHFIHTLAPVFAYFMLVARFNPEGPEMNKTDKSQANPTLGPDVIVWEPDTNLEAALADFKVEYEIRHGVPLADVRYERNPSRKKAEINKARGHDLAYQIETKGRALPYMLAWDVGGGRLVCLGGHHRSYALKQRKIAKGTFYVVKNVSDSMASALATADNIGGEGLNTDDRLDNAIELLQEDPSLTYDVVAKRLGLNPTTVLNKKRVNELRVQFGSGPSRVPHLDDLSDRMLLKVVLLRLTDPVTEALLTLLAKHKAHGFDTCWEAAEAIGRTKPRSEASFLAAVAAKDAELTAAAAAESGTEDAGSRRTMNPGRRLTRGLRTMLTVSSSLENDTEDPRNLVVGVEARAAVYDQAASLIERLRRLVKAFKPEHDTVREQAKKAKKGE